MIALPHFHDSLINYIGPGGIPKKSVCDGDDIE